MIDPNKLLRVSAFAGQLLLESGAETYRVEETMVRIARSYEGVEDAQSFVTPTGIMTSITYDDHNYSQVVRIQDRGVNLHRIDRINDLSRNINCRNITIDELDLQLHDIASEARYSLGATIFFSALGAGGFAFFFGGHFMEAGAAFIVGFAIKAISIAMERLQINSFFNIAISACVAEIMALISIQFLHSMNLSIIIISSIMLLVPGLAITNAIRDTVAGDYLSGLARAMEAFLVAIAIAIGTGIVYSLWIDLVGGIFL
ncbi:MAG: threonine/serine exporter family protein [Erysipelotrichaceae bacterium]